MNEMRLLITGASGQVGRAWRGLAVAHGIDHAAPDRQSLDLARPDAITPAAVRGFTHVINCAAWTDVDAAEANEDAAAIVNAEAVGALAEACRRAGATLVHYSTDYVFDGQAESPYETDHPRHPVNAYGRTKLAGELALESSGADFLLVRTSWVYAPWGRNFVRTIARLARERDALRVVCDQRGTPTSAEHLARMTLALLLRDARGAAHITDGGACTWHEFASEIVRLLGSPTRVDPCTSAEFPRPAARPTSSVLACTPPEPPGWRCNLRDVVARLPPTA